MEFSLPKTQINLSDKFNRLIIRRYNFYSLVLNLLISIFTSLHFTSGTSPVAKKNSFL